MAKVFDKAALNIDEQVNLLTNRGLDIPDPGRLHHYLHFIGYYRLSGYCRYFQIKGDEEHVFLPGTTFDNVLDLYIFDRELRLLIMDAIERIEVAVRSCITNEMGVPFGPHWFMDRRYFCNGDNNNHRLYAQAVVLYKFMCVIADGSNWQHRLSDLFDENPTVPLAEMGFPADWKNDPFWHMK